MRICKRAIRVPLLFLVFFCLSPSKIRYVSKVTAQDDLPPVIRVGVTYYDDRTKTLAEYQKLFQNSTATNAPRVTFNVVVGTYDQVLYWYQNDMVDLAVLAPGAVADLLTTIDIGAKKKISKELAGLYIGSRKVPSGNQPFIGPEDKEKVRFKYRALCVVSSRETENPKDSGVHNYTELRKNAEQNKLKYLFVHPLSVSGRILPEYLLQGIGELRANNIEWTYNHKISLQRLLQKDADDSRVKVAFIWDALSLDEDKDLEEIQNKNNFITFPIPDKNVEIPQEILVSTRRFKAHYSVQAVEKLLHVEHPKPKDEFAKLNTWMKDYEEVTGWVNEIKASQSQRRKEDLATSSISLEQIFARLRNYTDTHKDPDEKFPLRLALVLSGGGAKCAYQLGVIEAIELELQKQKEKYPNLDISIVVGTSGGAINALPVALGLTRDEDGQRSLYNLWISLEQRKLVQLWDLTHLAFGIWLGIFQTTLIICVVILRGNRRKTWWNRAGLYLLALTVLEVALSFFASSPWRWLGALGQNHILHHLWLIIPIGAERSAVVICVTGGLLLLAGHLLPKRQIDFDAYRRKLIISLIVLLSLSQTFWFATVIRSGSVVSPSGYEQAIVKNIATLLKGRIDSEAFERKNKKEKLKYLSQLITDGDLLVRDLIITGSNISSDDEEKGDADNTTGELPNDLYFYLKRGSKSSDNNVETQFDNRFVPLDISDNKILLLDTIIGSGSIYPLFPARNLPCVRKSAALENGCQVVNLIDGGFIHNSPIEAAVKFGATHIIVIEASPFESPTLSYDLISNSLTAFDYLFSQAQNLDSKIYGQREIFVIRPDKASLKEDPNLDTFDFSEGLIRGAVDKGLNDALDTTKPHFTKVQSQPYF